MAMLVGVDEAGRGPALGSMFVAAVALSDDTSLPDGVADSKTLTPDRRETLAATLRADPAITVAIEEIPVETIDRETGRLNQLTATGHAAVIDRCVQPGAAMDVIVDACDVDEQRFSGYVVERMDAEVPVRAVHGADANHPVVAAASIMAKSAREDHVRTLSAEYGNIGSGYPSDPTTQAFLEAYVDEMSTLPNCARTTWKPCQQLLASAEQMTLD